MAQLKPGDRVRCIEPGLSRFLELDKIYTFKGYLNDKWVQLEESDDLLMHWSQDRFVLAEQNAYSFDAIEMKPLTAQQLFAARAAVQALSYGFPKSSGIPSTARAIMDLVPERKTPPLTEKQQLQGENIARAVQNLSRHENRLGCAGWEP